MATTGGINGEIISNLIAEAFIRTFERDYVRMHELPDAITIMK